MRRKEQHSIAFVRRVALCIVWAIIALCVPWTVQAEILRVRAGDDLQVILNKVQPGDEIVLDVGATFTGTFRLPTKALGTPVTIIRSAGILPNRRVTMADVNVMPVIAPVNADGALHCENSHGWKLDGIRFLSVPGGFNEIIAIQNCNGVAMDRLLIAAGPDGQKRAIRGNGQNISLTRSHIDNIFRPGQESQGFIAWDGAGPYTIDDNFIEAASVNIMFGGADSPSADDVPSDIRVTRNHLTKRLDWKGLPRVVKNLFELKAAKRVYVADNLMEHSWTDAQTGFGIVATPRNQDGTAPWSTIEDVTFERNIVRGVRVGFSMIGIDYLHPSMRAMRIVFRNNVFVTEAEGFIAGGEVGPFTLENNTFFNDGSFGLLYAGDVMPIGSTTRRPAKFALEAPIIRNNAAIHRWGLIGDGDTPGLPTLRTFAPGFVWAQNVLAGPTEGRVYPPGTLHPTLDFHLAQFRSDYSLAPGSTYIGMGTEGKNVGATLDAPTPVDPCREAGYRLISIRWPTSNTGLRSMTWRLVDGNGRDARVQRADFVWPGQLTVHAADGCTVVEIKPGVIMPLGMRR